MKRLKKDLPIYVLSASLVFFGMATATKADAHPTDSARIRALENQLNSLKSCLNRQLMNITFYDSSRDRNIFVTRC